MSFELKTRRNIPIFSLRVLCAFASFAFRLLAADPLIPNPLYGAATASDSILDNWARFTSMSGWKVPSV